MKVDIDPSFQFTPFFENKLKAFLKEEFVRKVGMEVPSLWVPFLDVEVENSTGVSSIKNFSLSWYSGGSIRLRHVSWKSKSVNRYTGREDLDYDDVEIWMEGLDYFIDMLREEIPQMFRKHFWPNYRFIVEVKGLGMDTLLIIEAEKANLDKIIQLMDEAAHQWNESEKGLIHGIFLSPSRNKKLKIRIDTGSAGEPGIKALVHALSNSDLNILKLILSNAN